MGDCESVKDLTSNIWLKSDIPITDKTIIKNYRMKQLEYNETYLIKMRSYNGNQWSPFSPIIMVKTQPLKLTWRYNRNSKAYKHFNPLTESRMIIESRKYNEMYSIFGQNVLSKKKLSTNANGRFCVEFIVNKMSNSNYGTAVGLLPYPLDKEHMNVTVGSNAKHFALCMHFGINYIQIKYGGSSTNFYLNQWPWHKTRNGDSFILAMNVDHPNHIDVYHNGVHLPLIFQQLYNQVKQINVPKKFVFAASFCNDRAVGTYGYYTKKKRRGKKPKHVVADIEIKCLDESEMTMFRMVLRMIWYNLIPWFIRVNFRIIVFMLVILYYMFRYRHILRWNTASTESEEFRNELGTCTVALS